MYEIGIFGMPDENFSKEVTFWKNRFKDELGYQLYLDHIPHMTFCNFFVKDKFEIISELEKFCVVRDEVLNIKIKNTDCFKKDPITNLITPFFVINKNSELLKFQEELINQINNLIETKFKNKFGSKIYEENNNKRKYPFIGKSWIPHITVGSINQKHFNNPLIKSFLKYNIDYHFPLESISIYEISNTKQKEIANVNFNVR